MDLLSYLMHFSFLSMTLDAAHDTKLRSRRLLTTWLVSLLAQALNEHHHVMRKRYLLAEPADIAVDEFVPDFYLGAFDKAVE